MTFGIYKIKDKQKERIDYLMDKWTRERVIEFPKVKIGRPKKRRRD